MIWLTNTHTHTKGKPTIALFKFQDICKTSFHHKAAYNSTFQEVFQRPCWSHCGGSEWANSLPAPTQPEKRTGAAMIGTTWKILSFSQAATPDLGIFLPHQLHSDLQLSTKTVPNTHPEKLFNRRQQGCHYISAKIPFTRLSEINSGGENKVHSLNLVKSRSGEGKVEKITSSTNTSLRKKLHFYWQAQLYLRTCYCKERVCFTCKTNTNSDNSWAEVLLMILTHVT